ncbi:unnamed protein product [[Candida] boidinii]|nr:unnamed protein product [[Candida] boidinii]
MGRCWSRWTMDTGGTANSICQGGYWRTDNDLDNCFWSGTGDDDSLGGESHWSCTGSTWRGVYHSGQWTGDNDLDNGNWSCVGGDNTFGGNCDWSGTVGTW